jgi:hypothetical protein
MHKAKIFGIGFHKTGTKSLATALQELGYRVTGPDWIDNRNIAREACALAFNLLKEFDAFQDNPWAVLYRELDQNCPGSKFILTLRPTDQWLASVVRYFGHKNTPMRKWIYGVGHPAGNEAIYRERYERHNSEVLEYFKDRPDDLLILRITEGEGWQPLCSFLKRKVPQRRFPHVNSAGAREKA